MANKRGQGEGSISKRPNGTWWARVTIGKDENGKQVRQAFYGKTRKEVQTKMTAAINDINKGTYIEPSKMPYSQWLDIWMKEYKKKAVRKQTYCVYAQLIRLHINPALGDYQLKNIRPDVLQRLVNDMADKGLARSTIQKVKNVIKGSLDQAVKNDMLVKNPADSVVLPSIESKDKVILTPDEQALYIQTAKNYLYGKALVFILGTGLRMGEALALTWDDIDFTNRTVNINKNQIKVKDPDVPGDKWHLEVNPPKTKAGYRIIPLLPAMIQLLQEIRQEQQTQKAKAGADYTDNNLVFCCARGQRIEFGNIRWSNIHIRELAGIESKVSVHGLRHSFATRGLENGIPLKVMQELLGHASIKMTADLYTHVLPETKQAEMMKLEDTIQL